MNLSNSSFNPGSGMIPRAPVRWREKLPTTAS
jgi:hypothetical protein